MKVEAAYFYHKRAVDEKQGIYFAWPNSNTFTHPEAIPGNKSGNTSNVNVPESTNS